MLLVAPLVVLVFIGVLAAQPRAEATQNGYVCLFNAPVTVSAGAGVSGHVGWAYQMVVTADSYVFGATEGTGARIVPAGENTNFWAMRGTFADAEMAFSKAENSAEKVGYYTRYRCMRVPNPNPAAAEAAVSRTGRTGYNAATDNSVSKSIDILRAYGVGAAELPGWSSADLLTPNAYFTGRLGAPWGAPIAMGVVRGGTACLDVRDSSMADGAQVQTWPCIRSAGQQWTVRLDVDGNLRAMGRCMTVESDQTADGAPVIMKTCDGTASQQWSRSGTSLVHRTSGRCVTDQGVPGIPLTISSCHSGPGQAWDLPRP